MLCVVLVISFFNLVPPLLFVGCGHQHTSHISHILLERWQASPPHVRQRGFDVCVIAGHAANAFYENLFRGGRPKGERPAFCCFGA